MGAFDGSLHSLVLIDHTHRTECNGYGYGDIFGVVDNDSKPNIYILYFKLNSKFIRISNAIFHC